MSQQVMEIIIFNNRKYDIAAIENFDSFHLPEEVRLPFTAPSSSCWRGFATEFAVDERNRLVLRNIKAHLSPKSDIRPIRGVQPEITEYGDGEPICAEYRGIDVPVKYSGTMLACGERMNYWDDGFAPPMAYETVIMLRFQDGVLTNREDWSEEAERKREELELAGEDPYLVPCWSEYKFSLDLEEKWNSKSYRLPDWIFDTYYAPVFLLLDVTPQYPGDPIRKRMRDLTNKLADYLTEAARDKNIPNCAQCNVNCHVHLVEYSDHSVLPNSDPIFHCYMKDYQADAPGFLAGLSLIKQIMARENCAIYTEDRPAASIPPLLIWGFRNVPEDIQQCDLQIPRTIPNFDNPCSIAALSFMNQQIPSSSPLAKVFKPDAVFQAATGPELMEALTSPIFGPAWGNLHELQKIMEGPYEDDHSDQNEDDHWWPDGFCDWS